MEWRYLDSVKGKWGSGSGLVIPHDLSTDDGETEVAGREIHPRKKVFVEGRKQGGDFVVFPFSRCEQSHRSCHSAVSEIMEINGS